MDMDYRCFYQALRQQRVDIDYDDQRIQQLLKYQKRILQHIVYIKTKIFQDMSVINGTRLNNCRWKTILSNRSNCANTNSVDPSTESI